LISLRLCVWLHRRDAESRLDLCDDLLQHTVLIKQASPERSTFQLNYDPMTEEELDRMERSVYLLRHETKEERLQRRRSNKKFKRLLKLLRRNEERELENRANRKRLLRTDESVKSASGTESQ
jgi:hypothetical protein